jgi:hypothetical protein
MNQKLGMTAREEIRKAVTGLVGSALKAEVTRQARLRDVSPSTIYDVTRDLRPQRKKRADAGKRTFDINDKTSDLWYAVQLVVVDKLDPDQALLTSKVRNRTNLPTLETFRKLLHENGLGKTQRRTFRRGHRRWEAEAPGQIFQIDVTALKERWLDEKSRKAVKIEGIDKNHPQLDAQKTRVWQIMLVDDHSRRRFLRYVVSNAITSHDMVRFECEAYQQLGVPHVLYTDNGSEFKGQHIVAERILNSLLKDEGGYKHERHKPHNPQATGKVEGAHKWAEKADRFIGLAISEGRKLHVDDLNRFADDICHMWDFRVHRGTGEKPMNRWSGKRVVVRKLAPDVIESALLSDDFECVISPELTVTRRKVSYRLDNQFIDYIGQTVRVVIPPAIDMILVTLPNGECFEGPKRLAGVDAAGEYKTLVQTRAERITAEAKEARKLEIRAIKEQTAATGEIAPIPHLDIPAEIDRGGVITFPHKEFVVSAEQINEIVPVLSEITDSRSQIASETSQTPAYAGRPVTYWDCVTTFVDHFDSMAECKSFLRGIFADDTVTMPETQVLELIEDRNKQLEVASIRLAG